MSTPLTFNDVAKNIIKEAISSAIFIDDKALENFKTKNTLNKADNKRTLELYQDFKKNQCLLLPFKFTKSGWKKDKRFFLKNKDLLILDWQLVGQDHTEALKILDDAVSEKSLHFICIYTNEDKDPVKNEITRFFLGKVNDNLKDKIREDIAHTSLDDYWTLNKADHDWEEMDTSINNIINAKSGDVDAQIKEFQDSYELEDEIISSILSIDLASVTSSFAKLKTILTLDDLNFSKHSERGFFNKSHNDNDTFYIGHTIIKIFNKDEVDGDKLYESFLSSFMQEQNIFLTLMGLEMRNRFRENSAFIGKDFDQLNEEAFFHHKNKNNSNPYIFYDFLREILKDQISTFLYEKNLNLFDVLSNYYNDNDGEKKQKEFNDVNKRDFFIEQTFRLNNFYNKINNKERSKNDFLRFGDIFLQNLIIKTENEPDIIEKKYFLCVTPHCDCLNPKKIDNQFWFIEGRLINNSVKSKMELLEKADGRFASFVKIDGNVEAIFWENSSFECKPKTFFIENNIMVENKLSVEFNRQKIEFSYLESLKENYTQRLANKAFGYPMRVGIDFVKK